MRIWKNKVFLIIILGIIIFTILSACSCSEKPLQINTYEEPIVETSETPKVTISKTGSKKDIVDADGNVQGFVEIYDDYIRYINEELGYSFDLPKSWEDHFIVAVNYETKFISMRFFGESEEGRGIHPNGEYYGLCIFEIIYETDFEGLMYEWVYYLGTVDGIKLYHIAAPDCEICALYDEIEMYEYGESTYQGDDEQLKLMGKDLETVKKMVSDFDYTNLNFQVIE